MNFKTEFLQKPVKNDFTDKLYAIGIMYHYLCELYDSSLPFSRYDVEKGEYIVYGASLKYSILNARETRNKIVKYLGIKSADEAIKMTDKYRFETLEEIYRNLKKDNQDLFDQVLQQGKYRIRPRIKHIF